MSAAPSSRSGRVMSLASTREHEVLPKIATGSSNELRQLMETRCAPKERRSRSTVLLQYIAKFATLLDKSYQAGLVVERSNVMKSCYSVIT